MLRAHVAQVGDGAHEGILLDHSQAGVALELAEDAVVECLDDGRVGGVREHDVAALIEHLGPREVVDLDLAADVLGALAPLQLNHFDAEGLDGILEDAQAGVLDVGLDDDGAVTVTLPLAVGLDAVPEVRRLDDLAILNRGLHVHAADVLTDGEGNAGEGTADGQAVPVVLGDIGGAQARDDEGEAALDAIAAAHRGRDVNAGEQGHVGVCVYAVGTDGAAHHVEVRQVNGVPLLRGGGDLTERLGIDHLGGPHGRATDLAGPRTAVDARPAHPADGYERLRGAELGLGRSAGIDAGVGHGKPPWALCRPTPASEVFSTSCGLRAQGAVSPVNALGQVDRGRPVGRNDVRPGRDIFARRCALCKGERQLGGKSLPVLFR